MENFFVKIPNVFLEKGEEKVSPKELFLYFHLHYRKLYDWKKTITSIDLLSQEIKFNNREDRNKKSIKDSLYSLKDKGHINFSLHHELRYNTLLHITFNENFRGFTQIYPVLYKMAENENEFAIFINVNQKVYHRAQLKVDHPV